MNESKRDIMRTSAVGGFVLGLLFFLSETQSTGEALQRFKLVVSESTLAIGGITLMVLAVAALAILFMWEHKRHLGHF